MLDVSLQEIARAIMTECEFDRDKAAEKLCDRIRSDTALAEACIRQAALTALGRVASDARDYLIRHASDESSPADIRSGHPTSDDEVFDDAAGLRAIHAAGYLNVYLVAGKRLGDCMHADLEQSISRDASVAATMAQRIRFQRSILKSPDFARGKRVRECFSESRIRGLILESLR